MSQSLETRLFSAHLPLLQRGHVFPEPQAGVGSPVGAYKRPVSEARRQAQERPSEHQSLTGFRNPHGVWVYPLALSTQSELVRGRHHEPAPKFVRDAQGQWRRGFENLRALVTDSELTLTLAPNADGPRPAPDRSAKWSAMRNAQGDWEIEAA